MLGRLGKSGITNVEGFVLMSLLGLLSLVAIPSYLSHRANSQAADLSKKFRTYAMAFQTYAEEVGTWPPQQVAGQVPYGMESRLPDFTEETEIGGQWEWESFNDQQQPALSLVNPTGSTAVYARIDTLLDDGNLTTGCLVYNDNKITLLLTP